MIESKAIEANLLYLTQRYDSASDERPYYSKLVVLEFSGWIETSINDMIEEAGKRAIENEDIRGSFEDRIKGINGYRYNQFRNRVISLFGMSGYDKMQKSLNDRAMFYGRNSIFWSQMEALYGLRSDLAHSYIESPSAPHDAPSVVTQHFDLIKNGLIAYDEAVSKLE